MADQIVARAPYVPGSQRGLSPRIVTTRRSHIAVWWREVDRTLLFLVLFLMAIGSVAVAAASPASARRMSNAIVHYSDMHFWVLHLRWQFLGLMTMIAVSMQPRERVRRAGILLGFAMLLALILVLLVGSNINGAKRWLTIGISFQPSEFLKPAFAITLAWILSWRARDPTLPVIALASTIMALVALLLMLQPDFGSTILFGGVWLEMMLLSGLPVRRMLMVFGIVFLGVLCAYLFYGNAHNRIDAFFGGGSAYDQVDLARHTLVSGGWTGTGLWLGTHKFGLPEAHTDYIFSVIGEEFGLLVCVLIVLLYLSIVARVLVRLATEEDLFTVLAATGLVAQLGGQAFINIMVNLQMFPSKGMTLPLISYGGSSTLALCLSVGFLLALTRRNPFLGRDPFARKARLAQDMGCRPVRIIRGFDADLPDLPSRHGGIRAGRGR